MPEPPVVGPGQEPKKMFGRRRAISRLTAAPERTEMTTIEQELRTTIKKRMLRSRNRRLREERDDTGLGRVGSASTWWSPRSWTRWMASVPSCARSPKSNTSHRKETVDDFSAPANAKARRSTSMKSVSRLGGTPRLGTTGTAGSALPAASSTS